MFISSRLLPLLALVSLTNAKFAADGASLTPAVPAPEIASTDNNAIAETAHQVDQKAGATSDAPPDAPPPDTSITAVDGEVLTESQTVPNSGSSSTRRSIPGRFTRRAASDYKTVFTGTGTGPSDRDGSIEGTAYLTYTLVNNATYNVDDCLKFCDSVPQCVFANLYYEFNNPGLDSAESNLKCSLYADVHTAVEKTNRGGQQQAPGYGLTYIQQSSGYAAKRVVEPETPSNYDLAWGPVDGAANAPGYMGFAFLDRYDVAACASLCDTRDPDPVGGRCQFFNIWRALVKGVPTTYTCSMYYMVSGVDTAVNYGQGDLKVTLSRAYTLILPDDAEFIVDGGFEGYDVGGYFSYSRSYTNWIGHSLQSDWWDATFFRYTGYARTGGGCAILGDSTGTGSTSPGTITPALPLRTRAGRSYRLKYWQWSRWTYVGAIKLEVLWNGDVVQTIYPGNIDWTEFTVDVVAKGQDKLEFRGGHSLDYSFINDVSLTQINP